MPIISNTEMIPYEKLIDLYIFHKTEFLEIVKKGLLKGKAIQINYECKIKQEYGNFILFGKTFDKNKYFVRTTSVIDTGNRQDTLLETRLFGEYTNHLFIRSEYSELNYCLTKIKGRNILIPWRK